MTADRAAQTSSMAVSVRRSHRQSAVPDRFPRREPHIPQLANRHLDAFGDATGDEPYGVRAEPFRRRGELVQARTTDLEKGVLVASGVEDESHPLL